MKTSQSREDLEAESFLKLGSHFRFWTISAYLKFTDCQLSSFPINCCANTNSNLSTQIRIENYRLQDPPGFQTRFGKLDPVEVTENRTVCAVAEQACSEGSSGI